MTKLLDQTELTEEQKECVTAIDVSGQHLTAMLNDILDFSKVCVHALVEAAQIQSNTNRPHD